mgnify:CR=1 FL=1
MILQRISVRPSEYHARYSPLTTLSLTVMFSPCQNASFVSNTQFSKVAFLIYWKVVDTDLAFEKSEVDAVITTKVDSIKNPLSGRICVPEAGEVIMDDQLAKGEVMIGGPGAASDSAVNASSDILATNTLSTKL